MVTSSCSASRIEIGSSHLLDLILQVELRLRLVKTHACSSQTTRNLVVFGPAHDDTPWHFY